MKCFISVYAKDVYMQGFGGFIIEYLIACKLVGTWGLWVLGGSSLPSTCKNILGKTRRGSSAPTSGEVKEGRYRKGRTHRVTWM